MDFATHRHPIVRFLEQRGEQTLRGILLPRFYFYVELPHNKLLKYIRVQNGLFESLYQRKCEGGEPKRVIANVTAALTLCYQTQFMPQ